MAKKIRRRLKAAEKKLLRGSSPAAIESYFVRLRSPVRSSKWLATSNRYRRTCVSTFGTDSKSSRVQGPDLVAYVAASSPTHVIDGWSFLARGVEAALHGDSYSAIHFGYYAELRAAMGLLAAYGIGIFNDKHPVLDAAGAHRCISNFGTHKVVWPCLEHWAQHRPAEALFNRLIRPHGIDLVTWLQIAGAPNVSAGAAYSSWLRNWGVDLVATNEDHLNRNLVSYRPSQLRPGAVTRPQEVASFVSELWSLFEPSASRFPNMEAQLLREMFRKLNIAMPSVSILVARGMDQQLAEGWHRFLSAVDTPAPIREAQIVSDIENPRCHLQILSRAALLLYVAAGAARQHILRGSLSVAELEFWWHPFGEHRALWSQRGAPSDSRDAWEDIRASISQVREWTAARPNGFSFYEIHQELPRELRVLSGFEIGSIWGLLP